MEKARRPLRLYGSQRHVKRQRIKGKFSARGRKGGAFSWRHKVEEDDDQPRKGTLDEEETATVPLYACSGTRT